MGLCELDWVWYLAALEWGKADLIFASQPEYRQKATGQLVLRRLLSATDVMDSCFYPASP